MGWAQYLGLWWKDVVVMGVERYLWTQMDMVRCLGVEGDSSEV